MLDRHNIAVSRELHQRLKIRAACEGKTIQVLTAELLNAGMKATAQPNVHDVGRDSDPIGEDKSSWES